MVNYVFIMFTYFVIVYYLILFTFSGTFAFRLTTSSNRLGKTAKVSVL